MPDTTNTGGVDLLTLEAVLAECRNWFCPRERIYPDTYTITDGVLSAASRDLSAILRDGQYYRIVGSVFNDGLHLYRDTGGGDDDSGNQPDDGEADAVSASESGSDGGADGLLTDETFTGAVWACAIPPAVIALAKEIADWQDEYGEAAASPYSSKSENFANLYSRSYTKASGVTQDGGRGGWEAVFAAKLARYRKL